MIVCLAHIQGSLDWRISSRNHPKLRGNKGFRIGSTAAGMDWIFLGRELDVFIRRERYI
jgi:hypothetical protein